MLRVPLLLVAVFLLACAPPPAPIAPAELPTPATGEANAVAIPLRETPASRAELTADDEPDRRLTPDALAARYPVSFAQGLGFDPRRATGLDALQASALALSPTELDALGRRGFVITDRRTTRHFLQGYGDIYHADLPVYVTADAMLYALHAGFATLLRVAEEGHLGPALSHWLDHARAQVSAATRGDAERAADLERYLGVAAGLLTDRLEGLDDTQRALVARAVAASSPEQVELYGSPRVVDFSQFRPRGHYTRSAALSRYFRAVMWLGREGFRLTDVDAGLRVVRRRQVADALALHDALTPALRALWDAIEASLAGAMGEPDDLSLAHVDALRARLSAPLDTLSDDAVLAALDAVRAASPRVARNILRGGSDGRTVAQPVVFSALPQRYSPDAMALSSVVFDRVDRGRVPRMMPDPLDAAFASLANDHALSLLAAPLARHDYATELGRARALLDAHERAFWEGSLGAGWLHILRALSPGAAFVEAGTLPAVARTRDWNTRLLQTQMASWAEYRHDTLAYVAQSYTGSPLCSYPDGYVDPYPEFYARLERWAALGRRWLHTLPPSSVSGLDARSMGDTWFTHLAEAASTLRAMAEHQRTGAPFTPAHLAFLNRAVRLSSRRLRHAHGLGRVVHRPLPRRRARSGAACARRRRTHPAFRRARCHRRTRAARGHGSPSDDGGHRRKLHGPPGCTSASSRRTSSTSAPTSNASTTTPGGSPSGAHTPRTCPGWRRSSPATPCRPPSP
jgi:hypothetical protein